MRLIIMITYVLLKIVLCNTFVLERLTICLPIRVLVSIRLLHFNITINDNIVIFPNHR